MKNKKAFGLVEFLITLVVIGIISVLFLQVIDNKVKKDKEKVKFTETLKKEIIEELKKESGGGVWELMCDEIYPTAEVKKCSEHKEHFEPDKYMYLIVYLDREAMIATRNFKDFIGVSTGGGMNNLVSYNNKRYMGYAGNVVNRLYRQKTLTTDGNYIKLN